MNQPHRSPRLAFGLLVIFGLFGVAPAWALRPVQVSACALLVFGMIWFVLRLRG